MAGKKSANINSKVTIRSGLKNLMFTLVKPSEINISEGKISVESPLGKALLNHSINENVTVDIPAGTKKYKIIAID